MSGPFPIMVLLPELAPRPESLATKKVSDLKSPERMILDG